MNFKSLLTFAFAAAALSASAEAPYTYSVGDIITKDATVYKVVGDNLFTNGDFSNGLTDWTCGTSTNNIPDAMNPANFGVLEGEGPNGGNAIANISTNNNGAGSISDRAIRRIVELTPNKTYLLSFIGKGSLNYTRFYSMKADKTNGDQLLIGTSGVADWKQYSIIYTATEEMPGIVFNAGWIINKGAMFAYFNAVEVEEIETLNLTSSVATDWIGKSGEYNNIITTADGRSVKMIEHYYNNDVPAGEKPLYQTISNLPNGKYYVTLYATAFNAWKNEAGWLTTESTEVVNLYAKSGENTVTTPVRARKQTSYTTPDEYQIIVDVTDGTLELGMENLVANQVEWFTIQIKSLLKESTNDDAINVAKALAQEALDSDDYVNVTGEERTALEAALAAENATVESLTAATDTFKNAKPAYDAYASKVVEVNSVLDNCTLAATAKLDALRALIITPANAAAAETATGSFFDAIRLVVESNAVAEGLPTAEDFTSYIINPMAADGINGWTKAQMDGSANIEAKSADKPVLSETTIENYCDGGNWNGNDWTTRFEQITTGLPAGKYRVAVIARGSIGLTYFRMRVTNANGEASQVDLAHVGTADEGSHYTKGYREHVLDFETSGDILISIQANVNKNNGGEVHQWQGFTNFRLTKIGETEMQSYVTPDTWYYIKQVSSNLYWYTPGAALQLSGTNVFTESAIQTYAAEVTDQTKHKDHMFKFMPVAGKFGTYTIETGLGHSLALNGEWSMSTTENSGMSASEFSVEPQGENLVIKTAKGYLSSDDTNANSPLFSNKAADHANAAVTLVTVPQDHISTGIEAVVADAAEGDNVVYDLYGRRVENPSNGIYIVNGKKVVIR